MRRSGPPGALVQALAGREEADDLTEEERIASRDLVQPRDGPATHGRFGHRRDVRLDVRRCQAPQRDPPSDPGEFSEGVRQLAHALVGLPVGRHEQDPRLGQRVPQVAQQQQRRLVPRVQVVQDDEDWALGGGRRQEGAHHVEQAQPPALRHHRAGCRARRPGRVGEHDEFLQSAAQRADDLKPGPVRWRAALLPAATRDDPHPALRANPGELAHQPGLADARFTCDEHQRAAAGRGLLERGRQTRQLLDATDERSHGGSPGDRGWSDLLSPSPLHRPSVDRTARAVQPTARRCSDTDGGRAPALDPLGGKLRDCLAPRAGVSRPAQQTLAARLLGGA
jgi:hypothetical protein